jgi:hypothetical protein
MGTSSDDLCAFTAGDYPNYQDVAGDIGSVTIGTLSGTSRNARLLTTVAGAGRTFGPLKVEAIFGTAGQHVIWVGDDTSYGSTIGGTYGTLDYGMIKATVAGAGYIINASTPTADRIRANIKYSPAAGGIAVSVNTASGTLPGTIGILELVSCDIGAAATALVQLNTNYATVNEIIIDKPQWLPTGAGQQLVYVHHGTVGEVLIRDGVGLNLPSSANVVWHDSGTIGNIKFRGGQWSAGAAMFANAAAMAAVTVVLDTVQMSGFTKTVNPGAGSPVTTQYAGLSGRVDVNPFTPTSTTGFTEQIASSAWGNAHLLSSGSQNDTVAYTVPLSQGTWTLDMLCTTSTSRGIYTVAIDGATVGTIDGYAASGSNTAKLSLPGIAITASGDHTVTITMATKNASATAYYGSPCWFTFRRTAP